MANWFFWRRATGPVVKTGEQSPAPQSYSAPVTFESAMSVSAYWASARLLTETVAAMPLRCYKISGDSRVIDIEHHLFRLLNRKPNRYQTRIEYFESLMLNLVTTGNAYSLISRVGNRIISLMPLQSAQVTVHLNDDGSLTYKHRGVDNIEREYSDREIWHVKMFGNGITGLSPLQYNSRAISAAITQDERSAKYSRNGGKIGGLIETPPGISLKAEQRAAIRNELQGIVSGDNDFLGILDMGTKFAPTALNPADVQLLESRRFSVEDIARFMGVPSVLINDTSGSTTWGSGIGQLVEGFYKLNLRPYLERIESSIMCHLMPVDDYYSYSLELDFDSLLRADLAARLNANSAAINSGQMTPNEARAAEGRAPMPNGDGIYLNSTLLPAGTTLNFGGSNEKIQA